MISDMKYTPYLSLALECVGEFGKFFQRFHLAVQGFEVRTAAATECFQNQTKA